MSLFDFKKKKGVEASTEKVVVKTQTATPRVPALAVKRKTPRKRVVSPDTLIRPWFSEKALVATDKGVYVFQIPFGANKHDVAAAVEAVYKVRPRKIRVVNLPKKPKTLRSRRGVGYSARRRKAYVYLKKGDTITLT